MDQPRIFYPYEVDSDGSIQTIHRKLATHLHHKYSFTGFVRDDLERVADTFDRPILIGKYPKPVKGYKYAKDYFRKCEIVHTGQPKHFKRSRWLTNVASMRGAKTVHTLHTPFDMSSNRGKYQQRAASQADVVTAVYPYVREWAVQSLGISDVRLISNGVDRQMFRPGHAQTDPEQLLYVARFDDNKHPEFVVKLARALPELQFEVVGGTPSDHESLKEIPDNVTMHGWISKSELSELYASAALLLCPFEKHGAGMAALEAAASGTPTIALNDGASSYTVSDQVGLLLDTLDVQEWTAAVKRMLNDRDNYAPRDAVQDHSWETIATEYDRIYRELLN